MDSAVSVLDLHSPSVNDAIKTVNESTLMDFVEIWANQRDSVCQRLNGASITGIDERGLRVHSIWHIWEKEELSDLRGGYFEHSKTTTRAVHVPFPVDLQPVNTVDKLSTALKRMTEVARARVPEL